MICKTFEVRDSATFMPVMAVRLVPVTEADRYLLSRAGFGASPESQKSYVILMKIDGGSGEAHSDLYDWNTTTMQEAHSYIAKHFDELESGAVIDVEFILGTRPTPKESEAKTCPSY